MKNTRTLILLGLVSFSCIASEDSKAPLSSAKRRAELESSIRGYQGLMGLSVMAYGYYWVELGFLNSISRCFDDFSLRKELKKRTTLGRAPGKLIGCAVRSVPMIVEGLARVACGTVFIGSAALGIRSYIELKKIKELEE